MKNTVEELKKIALTSIFALDAVAGFFYTNLNIGKNVKQALKQIRKDAYEKNPNL